MIYNNSTCCNEKQLIAKLVKTTLFWKTKWNIL